MKIGKGCKLEERKQSSLLSRFYVPGISYIEGKRELNHNVTVNGFWLPRQVSLTRDSL